MAPCISRRAMGTEGYYFESILIGFISLMQAKREDSNHSRYLLPIRQATRLLPWLHMASVHFLRDPATKGFSQKAEASNV